jgi:membrane-bound acyltransferase YfiQ involved in biofilm formation
LVIALSVGAVFFLLLAFGGYSPLYRLLFGVMPYLSKIRAMGMVFFLTAFPICMLAGIGFERVLDGRTRRRTVAIIAACVVGFASRHWTGSGFISVNGVDLASWPSGGL